MREVLGTTLYSAAEAAELLGISERTLREYVKIGRIRAQKIGGDWTFTAENIQAFLQGRVPPLGIAANNPKRHNNAPVYFR